MTFRFRKPTQRPFKRFPSSRSGSTSKRSAQMPTSPPIFRSKHSSPSSHTGPAAGVLPHAEPLLARGGAALGGGAAGGGAMLALGAMAGAADEDVAAVEVGVASQLSAAS